MPRADRTPYTAEDLERGLLALALANGNATAASRTLKAQGHRTPKSTLQLWQKKHADRYARLRDSAVAEIHSRLAQDFEDLGRQAIHATADTVTDYQTAREAKDLKNAGSLASMARNLAITAGVSVDKVRPLRDMPTTTIEHRTPDQPWKRLQQLVPGLIVNGTAEEIPDATPVNGNGHHELPPAS